MTCSNNREYLFAFLDNELDAPLSIELQRHLDGCPGCAREAEIERTIRKRLEAAINISGDEVPAFDSALGEVVGVRADVTSAGESRDTTLSIRPRKLLAVAAAILLALGAGLWFALNGNVVGVSSPRFVDLVVRDFEHFLAEGGTVQLASADGDTVAEWLRGQTALAVVLPAASGPRCRLLGGRKCTIDGRPAAFAVYYIKDTPVSLVAVAGEQGDLPGGQGSSLLEGLTEVRHRGATHWVEHCRDYTVVACRRSGLVYAAVSTLAEEEILLLLAETEHEGH